MLDLLLPQRCVVCGCGGSQLCAGCRDGLPRIEPPLCARCGAPTAWPVERCRECAGRQLGFASARGAVGYDEAARRLVHAWKERGLRRLVAEAAQLVAERLPPPEVDALTFVPSDRGRRLERGYTRPSGSRSSSPRSGSSRACRCSSARAAAASEAARQSSGARCVAPSARGAERPGTSP